MQTLPNMNGCRISIGTLMHHTSDIKACYITLPLLKMNRLEECDTNSCNEWLFRVAWNQKRISNNNNRNHSSNNSGLRVNYC
mmetsp:Transcript_24410/g.38652  ORF Transcript_24410/g.38652 Transcript_24410/m.38652 type:complete len:82 (+) Transcript_24410:122-367(+)